MKCILQILLFSLGPFYVYPWKPIVNMFAGDSYKVSLKHFKEGHYGAVNLAGHFVCLFVQTFGNFGLLSIVDKRFVPQVVPGHDRLFSTLSAVIWGAYLATSPAPPVVTAGSIAALALAYFFGPQVPMATYEKASVFSLVAAITISNFLFSKKKIRKPLVGFVKLLALVPGIWFAWQEIGRRYAGTQVANFAVVEAGTLAVLTLLGALNNPVKKVVIGGMILCRLAGILTDNPVLFYLGMAFTASFFQGVTHSLTEEEATLVAIGDKGGKDALAFEYAHVVFFPNVLLHTIYDKLTKNHTGHTSKAQ